MDGWLVTYVNHKRVNDATDDAAIEPVHTCDRCIVLDVHVLGIHIRYADISGHCTELTRAAGAQQHSIITQTQKVELEYL